MTLTVLDRPVMTVGEAARQLRLPTSTLRAWLEGHSARGTEYAPVLRQAPTGSSDLTWGELVEARYLAAYRREKNVPLQRLRPFVEWLRQELGVPYPLAHARPFVDRNRQLLLDAARFADLPEEWQPAVEARSGQIVFLRAVDEYLDRVEFDLPDGDEGGLVVRLHPQGRQSPVVMDPLVRSGAATVSGTRTEAVAELVAAGEALEDVAADFDLSVADVQAAVAWEWEPVAS